MASSKKSGPSKAKATSAKAEDKTVNDAPRVDDSADKTDAQPAVESSHKDETPEDKTENTGSEDIVAADAADTVAGDDTPKDTDATETPQDEPEGTSAEPASTSVAETTHPVPVPAITEPAPRNNTFLPLVLGGIIAGVIGYGAAELDLLGTPDADPTVELRQTIDAQQERIAALESAEPPQVDIPEVDLSQIETQLGEIETRIGDLEARPVVVAPEGVDVDQIEGYLTELASLQQAVESQRDEIEGLIANAKSVEEATAEAARTANAQAALTRIQSAIDTGKPFDGDLASLRDAGVGEVDPALDTIAGEGVPTLSALQSEFPAEARRALAAARDAGVDGEQQGMSSFLKRQLGVRSVVPREGDDPDSVLSRAEASLLAGDLSTTLTELESLPDEARAAIGDWLDAAESRAAAQNAADAVSQRLTAD